MKKIVFTTIFKDLSLPQFFSRPLSKLLSLVVFMGLSVLHLQAQCPSPTATTAAITTDNTTAGTTSIASGVVRYVTGNITYGTSANAQSVDVQSGGTLVISAGSHFTVTNLSVSAGATLIIQAGASVNVVGTTGTNGNLNVNGGGIVKMCESSGIQGCGTTALTSGTAGTYPIDYVGATGGLAVIKTIQKGTLVGSGLTSSASGPLTLSSNFTVATGVLNSTFSMIAGTNFGSANTCTIGSNCTGLPFTVGATCGDFAGQTALTCPRAGGNAPTLTTVTKANTCPATTADLTTITATNLPSNTTLTWHTATPATTANKVTGTAVAAGTYYAAFYDVVGDCYSGASGAATTAVTATVASCVSGTTSGGAVSNVCPAATIDLNTHYQGTIPSGTTVTWHTSTPATLANKYGTPAMAIAGTYYAAFEDATNNCYSPTMGPVIATSNTCPVGTITCSKTQISPAPVVGQAGQKSLYVTINVTTAGCFSPITVLGSGMTLATGTTQVCTTTTGSQTFVIPVNYDGTALGTTNFTIGTAGSCAADLTKIPKKVISDVWTLDCVQTVGPSMK